MHHIVLLDADTLRGADLSALQLPGCTLEIYPSTTATELPARLQKATVVITNKVLLDAAMLALAPHLQLICVAATGINNIDLTAATARNIQVCNVRDYALDAVPQHAMALLLRSTTRLCCSNRRFFAATGAAARCFVCISSQFRV